jgi:sugar phosphate isomerase/epimerase
VKSILLFFFSAALWAQGLQNPFFAFDNGTGRDKKVPLETQAEMVKRAGYAGLGFTGVSRIPEALQALESRGLRMFSTYVNANLDSGKPPYDPGLPEAIRQLKGHVTMIWLTVTGKAADDARAVAVVGEIADLAAASGLRVALYPHWGMYVARIEDALRVVRAAARPNLGVSFNLAHFLAASDEPNLDQRLKDALPLMYLVSINGAEHEGNWSRLIQTLDRGEFDVYALLKKLDAMGYRGPIGLQAYQVPGEIDENLTRSMGAWRKFSARLAAEKGQ